MDKTQLRILEQGREGSMPLCFSSCLNQQLCSSVEPSQWPSLAKDTGLSDSSPQWKSFASPGAWSAHTQAEKLSHRSTSCRTWLPSPYDRKGWWGHLEAVKSSNTQAERQVDRADHPQSESSGPVQPRNLWHTSPWVKTTKSFCGFGVTFLNVPRQGNKFIALLIAEDSLQPVWPGNLTRAHRILHGPSNNPTYMGTSTENIPHAFSVSRAKLVTKIFSAQCCLIQVQNNELCRLWVPSCCPAREGKLIHSPSYCWIHYSVPAI